MVVHVRDEEDLMTEPRYERCAICDDFTGRVGRAEDSIYCEVFRAMDGYEVGDEIGPLCEECYTCLRKGGYIDD